MRDSYKTDISAFNYLLQFNAQFPLYGLVICFTTSVCISTQAQRKITVESEEENEDEDIGLVLEKRKAPSLTELDSSSSLSSLDETEESPQRPSLSRGTSNPIIPSPRPPHQSVSALRKMSAAFVSFFVPGKRVIRLVEDLSYDRRMAFGALVQDFLREQREALKPQCLTTPVDLLQGVRLFINQAKVFLLECGELEPPIETLVPEDEKGTHHRLQTILEITFILHVTSKLGVFMLVFLQIRHWKKPCSAVY